MTEPWTETPRYLISALNNAFLLRLDEHRVDGLFFCGQHQAADNFPHGYLGLLDRDLLPSFERHMGAERFASSGNLRGVGFCARFRGDLACVESNLRRVRPVLRHRREMT